VIEDEMELLAVYLRVDRKGPRAAHYFPQENVIVCDDKQVLLQGAVHPSTCGLRLRAQTRTHLTTAAANAPDGRLLCERMVVRCGIPTHRRLSFDSPDNCKGYTHENKTSIAVIYRDARSERRAAILDAALDEVRCNSVEPFDLYSKHVSSLPQISLQHVHERLEDLSDTKFIDSLPR